jgi:hypothetical protein
LWDFMTSSLRGDDPPADHSIRKIMLNQHWERRGNRFGLSTEPASKRSSVRTMRAFASKRTG